MLSSNHEGVRGDINYALGTERFAGRLVPIEVESTDQTPWILRHIGTLKAGKDRKALSRRVISSLN